MTHVPPPSTGAHSTPSDVEELGGKLATYSDRELLSYFIEAPRSSFRGAFHAIAETTASPAFRAWEVAEASAAALEASARELGNVSTMLTEAVHAAAFYDDSTLGRTRFLPEWNAGNISHEVATAFREAALHGDNVVVSASGVEHDELVAAAESYFAGIAAGKGPATPAATYVGGEERIRGSGSQTHTVVALGGPGYGSSDFAATQVLSAILGGRGGDFIKYPGSGVQSRLASHVTDKVDGVLRARPFLTAHADASLIGVYTLTTGDAAGDAADAVARALVSLGSKPATDEEVKRAVAQIKVGVAGPASVEVAAANVLNHGSVRSAADKMAVLDKVTAADVARVAKAALATRPTLVSAGALKHVPRLDNYLKHFA